MLNLIKTASLIALLAASSAASASSPLAFGPDAGQGIGAREISTDQLDSATRPQAVKPVQRAQMPDSANAPVDRATERQG